MATLRKCNNLAEKMNDVFIEKRDDVLIRFVSTGTISKLFSRISARNLDKKASY